MQCMEASDLGLVEASDIKGIRDGLGTQNGSILLTTSRYLGQMKLQQASPSHQHSRNLLAITSTLRTDLLHLRVPHFFPALSDRSLPYLLHIIKTLPHLQEHDKVLLGDLLLLLSCQSSDGVHRVCNLAAVHLGMLHYPKCILQIDVEFVGGKSLEHLAP